MVAKFFSHKPKIYYDSTKNLRYVFFYEAYNNNRTTILYENGFLCNLVSQTWSYPMPVSNRKHLFYHLKTPNVDTHVICGQAILHCFNPDYDRDKMNYIYKDNDVSNCAFSNLQIIDDNSLLLRKYSFRINIGIEIKKNPIDLKSVVLKQLLDELHAMLSEEYLKVDKLFIY